VIVALQIAYLPALYGSFNRREGLVSLLESRAGLPAWGPELLARHQLVGITDALPSLYTSWEEWSADVAESHTTYPVLLLFRSPEPWFSWLLGLLAVLDSAAMHLALSPSTASSQARLCLRMGFTLLNRIATTLGWVVDPDPNPEGPIELTFSEFERAVAMLESVGFPMERTAEEAWPDFRGWRVNYEYVAYRLADRITAPPAPWSGPVVICDPVQLHRTVRHSESQVQSIHSSTSVLKSSSHHANGGPNAESPSNTVGPAQCGGSAVHPPRRLRNSWRSPAPHLYVSRLAKHDSHV